MNIGAYSMAAANQKLAHEISVSVAKMTMDSAKTQAADLVQLISNTNIKSPVETSGTKVDVSI